MLGADLRSIENLSIRLAKEMRRGPALVLTMMGLVFTSLGYAQNAAPLQIGGGKLEIEFNSTPAEPLRKLVLDWVSSSAHAVTVYYEQFPVAHVLVRVDF